MSTAPRAALTFTREQIYERVWTTSVSRLAKEFGISGAGLAKACQRHDIPRPPLGYWAKKAVGKAPRKPPLPVLVNPRLQTVTLNPPVPRPPRPVPEGDLPVAPPAPTPINDPEIASAYERFLQTAPDLKVPEALRAPLPLVSATVEAMRRGAAADHTGYGRNESRHLVWPYRAGNEACLDVQVGRESIGRAARFLNTVLKALQKCGLETEETRDQYRRTAHLVLFGHHVQVRVRELTKRQPHTPTPKARAEQARYPDLTRVPKWDYLPCGDLTFELLNDAASVTHRTWTDGKARRIEDMLGEIIRGFFEAADAARARWKQQREEQRRHIAEWQQRQEAEERRKAEQARVDGLLHEVERWELSRRVRRYLRTVERVALERHKKIDQGSELGRWLDWGHAVADRNDPLTPREPTPREPDTQPAAPSR